MTSTRFRMHASLRDANAARADGPLAERLLRAIGADRAFTDDVLGDLTEERAERAGADGEWAARWWYLRELLRAVPHLAWNALRHGGTAGRVRVAALVGIVALVPTLAALGWLMRYDAPARLVVDAVDDGNGGVVVNTRHPVQLSVRAFDRENRPVPTEGTRYRLVTGDALVLSADGVLRCEHESDTMIRATLHGVGTVLTIRCRPVKEVRAIRWMYFIAGRAPELMQWKAYAPNGDVQSTLAGRVFVLDTSVARIEGYEIRPLRPGHTAVMMAIGDAMGVTQVSVFQPVTSFVALRPDQPMVIAPVRFDARATIDWPLPTGSFWLKYHRDKDTDAIPHIAVSGPVQCLPNRGTIVDRCNCLVRGPGAEVHLSHPGTWAGPIDGRLSLEMHAPGQFMQ
jgi:hypothetical protein